MEHNLYQQVILDHNKHPQNYGTLPQHTHASEGYNPLCGDHIWLQMALTTNTEQLREIAFKGSCCALAKASASLMTAMLKGKTPTEIKELFQAFRQLVLGESDTQALKATLHKLIVFEGVKAYPARTKCVLLPWHTAMAALKHQAVAESETRY